MKKVKTSFKIFTFLKLLFLWRHIWIFLTVQMVNHLLVMSSWDCCSPLLNLQILLFNWYSLFEPFLFLSFFFFSYFFTKFWYVVSLISWQWRSLSVYYGTKCSTSCRIFIDLFVCRFIETSRRRQWKNRACDKCKLKKIFFFWETKENFLIPLITIK